MTSPRFTFPPDTIAFFTDLRHNNDKPWFDANRARYESAYVQPAKAFVEAVAPALDELVPGIRAEPRVLGSIFRINRDTRFSTDKRPYKDHLDFWFWEGDRKQATSGLFFRVAPDALVVGAGAHGFDKDQLARYRHAVVDASSGAVLAAIVDRLENASHEVGGATYSRTPRGIIATAQTERLLRHSALFVHADLPAATATKTTLLPELVEHWRSFVPLHRWLVDNVAARVP